MSYTPTTWADRNVEFANRFTLVDNGDGTYTIQASPGTVTTAGTPVSQGNMNKIENGIANAAQKDLDNNFTADQTISKSGAAFIANATASNPRYWLQENGSNRGVLFYIPGSDVLVLQMYDVDGVTILNSITLSATTTTFSDALAAPGATFTGDVTISKAGANVIADATTGNPIFRLREAGSDRGYLYYDATNDLLKLRQYGTDGVTVINEISMSATATTLTEPLAAPGGTFTGDVTISKASPAMILDAVSGDSELKLRENGSNRCRLIYSAGSDAVLLRLYATDGTTIQNEIKLTDTAATFTDPIVLPADPTTAMQAVTKQYADRAAGVPNKYTVNGPRVYPSTITSSMNNWLTAEVGNFVYHVQYNTANPALVRLDTTTNIFTTMSALTAPAPYQAFSSVTTDGTNVYYAVYDAAGTGNVIVYRYVIASNTWSTWNTYATGQSTWKMTTLAIDSTYLYYAITAASNGDWRVCRITLAGAVHSIYTINGADPTTGLAFVNNGFLHVSYSDNVRRIPLSTFNSNTTYAQLQSSFPSAVSKNGGLINSLEGSSSTELQVFKMVSDQVRLDKVFKLPSASMPLFYSNDGSVNASTAQRIAIVSELIGL